MSEFHSLANLIKRLEVATTRLEDLAMSSSSASAVVAASNSPSSPKAVVPAPASNLSETPVTVEKHDAVINEHLEKYYALSQELGEPVAAQVCLFN
jgi:adenylyl cyclase-associated protein